MHSSLSTTSGILLLPVEVGGYIWEEIQSTEALRALSTTCKVFRHLSQYFLFRKFVLSFPFPGADDIESRLSPICERLGGLSTNRRLLSYIREMEICAHSDNDWYMTLSPFPVSARPALADCIEGMTSVKSFYLRQTIISPLLAQAIIQASARQVIDLRLDRCSFSTPTGASAAERLRISNLDICIKNTLGGASGDGSHDIPFLGKFVRAARLDVKSLTLNNNNFSNLRTFLNVHFPSLQSFILQTLSLSGVHNPSLCLAIHTFLHNNPSITRLKLLGSPRGCGVFEPFHPTCLPHLQELESSAATVQQLVPGRPVESITVYIDDPSPSLPALSVLAKSTSVVKELNIFVGKCGATWAELMDLLETSTPKLEVLNVIHQGGLQGKMQAEYLAPTAFSSLKGLPHLRSLTIDYPKWSMLDAYDFSIGENLARMRHPSLISLNILADLDLAQISWKRDGAKWVGVSDMWEEVCETDIETLDSRISVFIKPRDSTEATEPVQPVSSFE